MLPKSLVPNPLLKYDVILFLSVVEQLSSKFTVNVEQPYRTFYHLCPTNVFDAFIFLIYLLFFLIVLPVILIGSSYLSVDAATINLLQLILTTSIINKSIMFFYQILPNSAGFFSSGL
jgi:hypothetical protein